MKKLLILGAVGALIWGIFSVVWKPAQQVGQCAFCDEGVLERQTIYRGELASIIATYKPVVNGHLLVIPNRHVETFDGLTSEELAEMGTLMKKGHITEQYLVLQKNGILAGQSVPHVHFHILPRGKEVSVAGFIVRFLCDPWRKPLTHEEMKVYVTEMSEALDG